MQLYTRTICHRHLLLLRGVGFKAPCLAKSVHLAVLLKHSSILSGSLEVLADQGINTLSDLLVVEVGPASAR